MPPKLELRDVTVRRGQRTTLVVDHLAVEAGQILAVIGPNGAGKSTLLQVAGLLLRPATGEVRFAGAPVGGDALAYRRRTAFAMQEAVLIGGSVLDNVALGLKLRGVPRREREERSRRWLRRFGIEALASRPASKLSGGEAQRASLARAFVIDPELLLLDEPFGGLDQPLRHNLLEDLASVLRETGVATVFVTHDRNEALRLAHSVAVVLDGRVRQVGPTADVFGKPVDEAVAAFVGVETIVSGRVIEVRDGRATVDLAGQRIVASANGSLGSTVKVCLRPEDVLLHSPEAASSISDGNVLRGVVQEVRAMGSETRVLLACGPSAGSGRGFPLVATASKRLAEDLGLAVGKEVAASFRESAVHLLPGDGEGR